MLLELIEQEKLDITTISLAQITEQYLDKIKAMEASIHPDELSDFLLIAAKLLVIKSRVLLPQFLPETEDENELEKALRMYKIYRDASLRVEEMLAHKRFAFEKRPAKISHKASFTPPENLNAGDLGRVMRSLILELDKGVSKLPKKEVRSVVSIGERISQLKNMLSQLKEVSFNSFVGKAKHKADVVVSFLALLELIKQRHLSAHQEDGRDILIRAF